MEKKFFPWDLRKFRQVIRTYSAGAKCTSRPYLSTLLLLLADLAALLKK